MIRPHRRPLAVAAVAAFAAVATVPAVAAAGPSPQGCANQNLNQVDKLLRCVDADGVETHLAAFQGIADANGDTRASGTPGYDASADYVAELVAAAGYTVERQVFDFSLFTEVSSSLTVDNAAIETQTFEYSGSGDVTNGNVIPVDLALGLGNTSTSGCEPGDFTGLDFSGDNDIAHIQRGACDFVVKAENAQDAGAEAVIIFNQGNTDEAGRQDIIGGTLGEAAVGIIDIPVLDTSYTDGVTISEAESVSLAAVTEIVTRSTENIIADLPGANPDNVVMAGAHLDSVPEGPGINDNGSGSAALLTVALALGNNKRYTPQNTLRFAWWGAEEAGLVGSDRYVFDPDFGLTQEEYDALALYINFDMVGSPNFVYGVYDADESSFLAADFGVEVPAGSVELEDLFEQYFTWQGIPYDDSAFSGRSDYEAFILNDIPASGLFTGAEVLKRADQEDIWGGVTGAQFDPCYHQACDSLTPDYGDDQELADIYAELDAENDLVGNVSLEALGVNSDAIAFAVLTLAYSTEGVNGVEGRMVPGSRALDLPTDFDGPQGTGGTEELGGNAAAAGAS
jgi:Zn-dependent M28 family amino/carboxypeptidase